LGQQTPTTSADYSAFAWDSLERAQDSTLSAAYLAITNDSTRVDDFVKIADIYKTRKRRDLQMQIASRLLRSNPASAMSYVVMGDALFDNQYPDSAIGFLKKAVRLSPGFVRAHTIIAEAYSVLSKPDTALMYLDTAISYNPRYAQARVQRAALLTKLGKDLESIEDYRAASELLPMKFDAWYKLGQALARVHDYDEAANALSYAMTLNPNSADALFLLAESNEKSGHMKEAIESYEQFYLTFPTNGKALEAERRARELGGRP
jgi:tetratricopeptide (TPR) repeat protein